MENAGIETDKFGFVKVNHRLETNVPGIWALGDVNGGPAFTHISYNDFQIVDANLTQGKNLTTENRIVPYCVFTDPQLGGVGITEKEARRKGYKLKIGQIPMSHVARAIERDETAGLMKIIIDATNDRILGQPSWRRRRRADSCAVHADACGSAVHTIEGSCLYPSDADGRIFRSHGQRKTGRLKRMREDMAQTVQRIRRLRRSQLPGDTIKLARYLIGKTVGSRPASGPPERAHC